MPATTRVVQMDPGPIPTLTQSAPASIRAFAPSAVAMLPAITGVPGNLALTFFRHSMMFLEWPWAESSARISTPEATRAAARSSTSPVTPMAAAHSRRPWESRAVLGYLTAFSMSLMVIRPFRAKLSSTRGSFSILWAPRIFLASAREVLTGAVIRLSLVITSPQVREKSSSNFRSRLVRMPTRRPSLQMGTPEMRYLPISWSASASVCSGDR